VKTSKWMFGAGLILMISLWMSKTSKNSSPSSELLDENSTISRTPAQIQKRTMAPLPKILGPSNVLEKTNLLTELHSLKDCYRSQSCPFPQTDPRAYDFALGQALKQKIQAAHAQLRGRPEGQETLRKIAKEFVQVDDGYVQEAALDVFASLPPDAENLRAITEALALSDDPSIIEKAMGEFRRYLGRSEEPMVQEFLQKFLQSGSHFASQTTVRLVLPFINQNSFEGYESVFQSLPKSTQVSQDLKTVLEEYQNLVSGG
jgi:hypothetical protein